MCIIARFTNIPDYTEYFRAYTECFRAYTDLGKPENYCRTYIPDDVSTYMYIFARTVLYVSYDLLTRSAGWVELG